MEQEDYQSRIDTIYEYFTDLQDIDDLEILRDVLLAIECDEERREYADRVCERIGELLKSM